MDGLLTLTDRVTRQNYHVSQLANCARPHGLFRMTSDVSFYYHNSLFSLPLAIPYLYYWERVAHLNHGRALSSYSDVEDTPHTPESPSKSLLYTLLALMCSIRRPKPQ